MQSWKTWRSSVDSIMLMQILLWRSFHLNHIISDISVKALRHDLSQQLLWRWTWFRWLHKIKTIDQARRLLLICKCKRPKLQCLISINVVQKWCRTACKKYNFKDIKLIFCPLTSGDLVGLTKKPWYYLTVTVDVEYLTVALQIKVMLVRSFITFYTF